VDVEQHSGQSKAQQAQRRRIGGGVLDYQGIRLLLCVLDGLSLLNARL
jgi:hypothetical protein